MTTKVTASTLANTAVTTGTYGGVSQMAVVTIDPQGRVTFAANATPSVATTQLTGTITNAQLGGSITSDKISTLSSALVTTALGFTPYNATNPNSYLTSITSGQVTGALGFTPYNATNPSGYLISSGTIDTATNVTNGLGRSQSYSDVTGSRSRNTTYTNSTSKPIFVSVCWDAPRQAPGRLYVAGAVAMYSNQDTYPRPIVCGIVPAGSTYYVDGFSQEPYYWLELR